MARELTDSEKALAKEILDKVYDSTMEKEVGMLCLFGKMDIQEKQR